MPFNIGAWEMILVFLVVLLFFGAKRLPEIGTSLGKGIREFKSSVREIQTSVLTEQVEKPKEPAAVQATDGADDSSPRRLTTS